MKKIQLKKQQKQTKNKTLKFLLKSFSFLFNKAKKVVDNIYFQLYNTRNKTFLEKNIT